MKKKKYEYELIFYNKSTITYIDFIDSTRPYREIDYYDVTNNYFSTIKHSKKLKTSITISSEISYESFKSTPLLALEIIKSIYDSKKNKKENIQI